jgi:hypothetical protein
LRGYSKGTRKGVGAAFALRLMPTQLPKPHPRDACSRRAQWSSTQRGGASGLLVLDGGCQRPSQQQSCGLNSQGDNCDACVALRLSRQRRVALRTRGPGYKQVAGFGQELLHNDRWPHTPVCRMRCHPWCAVAHFVHVGLQHLHLQQLPVQLRTRTPAAVRLSGRLSQGASQSRQAAAVISR